MKTDHFFSLLKKHSLSAVRWSAFFAIPFALFAPMVSQGAQNSKPAKESHTSFSPFTGKVSANKVRMRLKPDTESHILRQVNRGDLLLIVREEGDFYAVQPPKETKAYVFRSYILDDVVEANRVNVRLEPHVDAPIIGQLQIGEKVKGKVSPLNHKWLEISVPKETYFYISKEFINQAGGPEYLAVMEKRKAQVEDKLSAAYLLAEAECKKDYEEMSLQTPMESFQEILQNFQDFPDAISQAREGLSLLKETFLNKKIAYLEAKAELSSDAKQELISKHEKEKRELLLDQTSSVDPGLWEKKRLQTKDLTDAMRFWDTLEESLYLSWSAFHTGKHLNDFYAEQKANATVLSGKIDAYTHPVREKPGDYLLLGEHGPIAYLYSTHVDLGKLIGKEISLLASPRPNHHFAFPAYFVLSVDD